MKTFIALVLALLVIAPDAASARTRVTIQKRPPHVSTQPVPPLAIVPPLAVAFDLIRRTSCDPAVAVATGPNDPGFTSHPAGNYLVPAIYRSECRAAPK
jgi:hypothetical protein